MKTRLYTIYDKRAEESGPLFQAKNDAVALRNYESLLAREEVKETEYKLLCVGLFDNEKCLIFPQDPEEVILKLSSEVE